METQDSEVRRGFRRGPLLLAGGILCVAVFALVWYGWPFYKIRRLQERYETIAKGSAEGDVRRVMGELVVAEVGSRTVLCWEDDLLPEADAAKITYSLFYSVDTFYLPVSFEFGFDVRGRVVGKHRLD